MNKSYKSIWNESLGTWVAVSEISGARGKPSRNRKAAAAGLALALLLPGWQGMASASVVTLEGSCVNGMQTAGGVVGSKTYPDTPGQATDGTGTYSTVAGCGASGGGQLAATGFGGFAKVEGQGGTALGFDTKAAKWATAVGLQALADGEGSSALGYGAQATFKYTAALGAGARATSPWATAVGNEAIASAQEGAAFGQGAAASNTQATAIGSSSNASGLRSAALGYKANATKEDAVALGNAANAAGLRSMALGPHSVAAQDYGTAVGSRANVNGQEGTALGQGTAAGSDYATAVGSGANADGTQSTALGYNATAMRLDATAVGSTANAGGLRSTALGVGAKATKDYATAVGNLANATGLQSTALGYGANALGYATAVGTTSNASGSISVAVGSNTEARGERSTALGATAAATNDYATAIGTLANASGAQSTALGESASATKEDTLAAGSHASASGLQSTALGVDAKATQNYATALGNGANATGLQSTALGQGAIAEQSYATAVGQGANASGQEATALGQNAAAGNHFATAAGSRANASSVRSTAVGYGAKATQESATAVGSSANASGTQSIAMGFGANARGAQSISIGTQNNVNGAKSGAVGDPTNIDGTGSYSLGNDNNVAADSAGVFGNNNTLAASGKGSRVIGNGNTLAAADAFIIGNGSTVGANGGVALGSGAAATTGAGVVGHVPTGASIAQGTAIAATRSTTGAVAVGNPGGGVFRQVTGLAAGTADSDAVNVSQLKAVSQAATGANAVQYDDAVKTGIKLGGATSTDGGATNGTKLTNVAQGSLLANSTDAVNGSQLSTTNSTVAGLGNSLSTANSSLTGLGSNLSSLSTSLAGGTTGRVQATGTTNQLALVEPGMNGAAPGAAQQLTNVAAGRVVANGTDAVNGGQLFETNQVVASLSTTAGNSMRYDNPEKSRTTLGGLGADGNAATSPVTLANVADGSNANDAVNFGQLSTTNTNVAGLNTSLSTLAASPLTFKGNSGEVAKRLGDTLDIAGTATTAGAYSGANLRTVVDATTGAVNLQMAQAPVFDSVAMPNGTKLDGAGLSINGGPKLTTDGIDAGGKKIGNVGPGTADGDVANFGQVKGAIAAANAAAGTAANAVQYDDAVKTGIKLGGATSTDGGATNGTKLTNVAQGSLLANSTDAVNGSQLSTTNSTVAGLGNSLSTANSSLTGLGSNLSSLSTSLVGGTIGRVQATGTTNQLALVEPGMTGAAPGAAQQLTNVAAGRVVANGTDAVNGGQLFETNRGLSTTNSNVAGLNSSLSTVNSNVAGLGNGLSTTNSSLSALAVNPLTFKGNSGEVARRLGDTLEIAGTATTAGTYSGANLRTVVDATTGTVNIQMAQAPVFDSVAMPNGTKLDGAGLTINGGPKVTTEGIDAGGKKIGNVGAGTADGDVANFGQVKGAIAAANAAAGTAANSVQYDGTGKNGVNLGGATSTDGGATNGTKLTNVAQGSLRDNSTEAVNGSQLSTTNSTVAGLGNSLSTTNSSLAGLGGNLSSLSTSLGGGTIGRVQATGTTNQLALVEPGMTGAAPGAAQQLTNVAAGRVVANGTDAVNGGQLFETNQVVASLSTTAGNSMRYDNPEKSRTTLGGLGTDGNAATSPVTLANVADGRNANDAVNFGQLSTTNTNVAGLNTSLSTLAASPLTFKANSGEVAKRLGDTLTIAGTATTAGSYSGANLRTVVDATTGAVNLQMAQAPVFDSVAMPNGTKLDGSGLTINGGPKVTTDGIDAGGKRIGNVGSGTENTDAANVGQVREAVRAVNAVAGTAGNSVQYADAGRNRITLDGPASTNGGATNGTKLTNVAQGLLTENSTDAVNGSQLSTTNSNLTGMNNSLSTTNSNVAGLGNGLSTTNSSLSALAVNPLNFRANSGEVARRLGDTLTIRGDETTAGSYSGANLRTMIDAATGAVNLQMAQSPVFDAVAMPNGTRLDGAGLSINGGPKVTTDGIDAGGKRISNVGAGTADSDVVNFGQVKQAIQNANAPVGTGGHLVQYDDPDEDGITLGDSTSTNGGATGGTKLTNLAQGALTKNSTDAVNGSQLSTTNSNVDDLRNSLSTTNTGVAGLNSSLSTLAVNPLTFKGNSGEVAKKLGDTLSIIGAATTAGTYAGANLKTVVDATTGAVNVQMAQAPVFDSVAMPNGTKLDGSGLTINGGPKVTTDGIDAGGKKIGNVGAGTADGDVANFGQIKDAIATANAAAGTAANAVQYDDASKTGVKLGGANSSAPVKLSNVADGSNANDAVNFGQLSNLGNGLAGTLGGTYAGGVYQAPTFTTIGGPATTVQGALTNLGNAVAQGTAGPVQTAGMPNQLVLVETGKRGAAPGAAQTLTNLASGTVAKDSKDAVNGGQLFTLQEDIKSLNGNAIKFDGADKAQATLGGKTSTDGGLTNGTKLSNVAQGAVGQGSTDAVNGAQLHATNTAVTDHAANTSAYLGGGADVAAGKAPAYAVQGGSFNNVGAALGAVDQNLSTLNNTVSTLGAATQNAVQYDGKDKGGVTLGGAKSTDGGATNGTKIGNVAQGSVSAMSTDAINGAQLAASNRTVSDFIGGGADATTGKAPSFAVQGTTSNTVGCDLGHRRQPEHHQQRDQRQRHQVCARQLDAGGCHRPRTGRDRAGTQGSGGRGQHHRHRQRRHRRKGPGHRHRLQRAGATNGWRGAGRGFGSLHRRGPRGLCAGGCERTGHRRNQGDDEHAGRRVRRRCSQWPVPPDHRRGRGHGGQRRRQRGAGEGFGR
jgi:autotransporter adhesin